MDEDTQSEEPEEAVREAQEAGHAPGHRVQCRGDIEDIVMVNTDHTLFQDPDEVQSLAKQEKQEDC